MGATRDHPTRPGGPPRARCPSAIAALDDGGVLLALTAEPIVGEASAPSAWRIPLVTWRRGATEAVGDLGLGPDEGLVALAVFDGAAHALIAIDNVNGTQGTRVVRVGAGAPSELFRDDAAARSTCASRRAMGS